MSDDYENKANNLIDFVTDYAIFRVSTTGVIETWNIGASKIKGYEADEIIGKSISTFYSEEDVRSGLPQRGLAIAAAEGRYEDEGWRIRRDGTQFRALVIIDPIRNVSGEVVGFVKITRDISAQYELDRTREQLLQAQKLEIVGHLTGGVAHDFNNLLTAILGCLDLVTARTGDIEVKRFLDSGRTAAGRGQKLVSQLQQFARKQTLWPQTTDIDSLIEGLQPLFSQALGEHIKLTLVLDSQGAKTNVDQTQLQSALMNVVINARDAMTDGGELVIRTLVDKHQFRTPRTDRSGSDLRTVVLEVRDTGSGMDPTVAARAVEPFFTTKGVGEGSGLGLSQVYGFTTQSGGDLQIESVQGQGTVIRMLLPEQVTETDDRMRAPAKRDLVVLVVEDDDIVRGVCVNVLAAAGYKTIQAASGDEGLEIIKNGWRIDLLLSDIVMPGRLNGVVLAQLAAQNLPGIKVLLTSGYPRETLIDRYKVTDEVAFLPKPYGGSQLIESIGRVMQAA